MLVAHHCAGRTRPQCPPPVGENRTIIQMFTPSHPELHITQNMSSRNARTIFCIIISNPCQVPIWHLSSTPLLINLSIFM